MPNKYPHYEKLAAGPRKIKDFFLFIPPKKFSVLLQRRLPDQLRNGAFASSEQTVLLQFLAQCVAVNT